MCIKLYSKRGSKFSAKSRNRRMYNTLLNYLMELIKGASIALECVSNIHKSNGYEWQIKGKMEHFLKIFDYVAISVSILHSLDYLA